MVNATAFASAITNVINLYGATGTYYPPQESTTYNSEGDWTRTYETGSTTSVRIVEAGFLKSHSIEEMGNWNLKENDIITTNTITPELRGKIVSNNISWEITEIRPQRMKNTVVANVMTLRNMLP